MQQHAVHDKGSWGLLPQKILKIRCSEVQLLTLSSEIEHRKVVKKLIFKGPLFSLQGQYATACRP